MSDGLGQTLADAANKTARNSFFTLIGHGAAALALPFVIWGANSLAVMREQLTIIAERQMAAIERIARNERTIERIDGEDVTQADLAFRIASIEFRVQRVEKRQDDTDSRIRIAPQ